jgi:hypothetical protein
MNITVFRYLKSPKTVTKKKPDKSVLQINNKAFNLAK